MKIRLCAFAFLSACCLMLGACQDKHEPIKPTRPTVFAAAASHLPANN